MEKQLHIVCHDVPYPADYGGVFDLFYKLEALHKAGVKIHLHCYEYGRGEQPELNKYCVSVNYYQRQKGHKGFSMKVPYIVGSRTDPRLKENLLCDNHPILFEGVHTTWLLHEKVFQNRKTFIRMHNVEYKYYQQLCRQTKSLFKKAYFWNESRLLKKYERALANESPIICVSQKEAEFYHKNFKASRVAYISVFTGWKHLQSMEGAGSFCLYQGNLSVPENDKAATWLVENVFGDSDLPFIVAGKNPSPGLQRLIKKNSNTCLVANPGENEMQELIAKAQVNILPSFSDTGIKLKLLNAVFCGKHVLTNKAMVDGTHLESACHIVNEIKDYKDAVKELMQTPFSGDEMILRESLLQEFYNNDKNARELIAWIW
ncbi:glycosyltransferase family 4 protein [Pollutibacter soli]|uniref:glycosyltransferase n=1 Tax=Pollutibacter soli TaxID=3034157 RepID=UPI003013ECC9